MDENMAITYSGRIFKALGRDARSFDLRGSGLLDPQSRWPSSMTGHRCHGHCQCRKNRGLNSKLAGGG